MHNSPTNLNCDKVDLNKSLTGLNWLFLVIAADAETSSYLADAD